MPYQYLDISVKDHIARVQLHRPPVNALNKEMVAELVSLALEWKVREDIWVIAVTSAEKVFCAGADLKERSGVPDSEVINFVNGIQRVAAVWCDLPQPVIMGVNGAALGGGCEFMLAGDIIVAGENAKIGLPEVSLGIIPAAGGTQRIAQRAMMGIAKKWILSAKHFSAKESKEDGIVDFLVSSDNFEKEFEEIVSMISGNAPLALRQAKRAVDSAYQEWLHEGFEHEIALYTPLIPTNDRKEALKALAEKRKPKWTGL